MVNSNHESLQENMQRSLNRPLAEFLKHFLNFEKAPPSRAHLKDNFPAIATATSPHPPSTKSAVVDTRRRRILRSLFSNIQRQNCFTFAGFDTWLTAFLATRLVISRIYYPEAKLGSPDQFRSRSTSTPNTQTFLISYWQGLLKR